MKKLIIIIGLLISMTAFPQETVTIGAQQWMKENVSVDGNEYFTWEEAQTVCPEGFRVPSKDDFRQLNAFLGGGLDAQGNTALTGNAARHLREVGFDHWFKRFTSPPMLPYYANLYNSYFEGWDTYGFSAKGTGVKIGNSIYQLKEKAYFWTSSEDPNNEVWFRSISYPNAYLYEGKTYKTTTWKMCVRCIKN